MRITAAATTIVLSSWPAILAAICGFGASQLTSILTARSAPQWIKSGVNLVLTTLAGVLITINVLPTKNWEDYAAEIGVAWAISMLTYAAGMTKLAARATDGFGIGAGVSPLVPRQPPEPVTTDAA